MRPVEWFPPRRGSSPLKEATTRNLEEALGALDSAIRKRGRDGSDDQRLRMLIVEYCGHARDAQLTPEAMLIRLKHTLEDALVVAIADPIARETTRTLVVTLAIDSYYDDRR